MQAEQPRYHYIYICRQRETGEFYIGRRSCRVSPLLDPYMGSGVEMRKRLKSEKHLWEKEVVLLCDTLEEVLEMERIAVGTQWRDDPLCINRIGGGISGLFEATQHQEYLDKLSVSAKKQWEDPAYMEYMSMLKKQAWDDPIFREKSCAAMRQALAVPERRKAKKHRMVSFWADPNNAKARGDSIRQTELKMLENGVLIKVPLVDLRVALKKGIVFKALKVYLHDPCKKVQMLVRASTAAQMLLSSTEIEFGFHKEYKQITLAQFRAGDY